MSFWKSRADIQDRYRRELFAGTVVACNADGTYDVALPGAAEPVRGVANAGELRFQAGNRVVVTRAGGRDGWQIHAGMAAGAPTRALNPDALIDAPPLVYWGGLTRSGAEAETIADYVDGRRWPLAALLRSGAEDGQMPLWSDAAGAWVPSSAGGQNVGALRALAAAGLAGCIAGAQRPWLVPPCVGGWLMIIGMETDPGLSAGAFVYSATSFGHVRAGAYPVQAMTLAYWKLDEAASSQNALDCSGHLRDLTPYEMSSSVSGAFYGARQWNGVTSYLHRAALPLQGSNQLSIELWIKPDSLANSPLLFYQEGSGSLQFEGGGTALRLYVITGGGTAVAQATTDPAVLCDGSWHYLAGVYDGATLRLYVDGQQTGTTPTHSGNVGAPASTNCYLGVHAPGWTYWSRYYDGAMDEVRITQGAVSAGEIAKAWAGRLALRAVTSRFTAPAAWSHAMLGEAPVFNDGTITYDLSADNGATWTPAATWDWTVPQTPGTEWRIRAALTGKAEIHRLGLVGL